MNAKRSTRAIASLRQNQQQQQNIQFFQQQALQLQQQQVFQQLQNQQNRGTPATTTTITNNTTVNNSGGFGGGNVFIINNCNANNGITNGVVKNSTDEPISLASMTNAKSMQNYEQINNQQILLLPEGSPSCCTTKALDDSGLGDFSNGGIGGEESSLGTINFQQLHQNTQIYQQQQNAASNFSQQQNYNQIRLQTDLSNETCKEISEFIPNQNTFQHGQQKKSQHRNAVKNFDNENAAKTLAQFQSILTPQTTLLELLTVAQNNPQHSNLLLNACFVAAAASNVNDRNIDLSNFAGFNNFLNKGMNNTMNVDPVLNNVNSVSLNNSNGLIINNLNDNDVDPNLTNCTNPTFASAQTGNHLNNFNGISADNLIKFTLNGNDIVLGGNTSTLLYPSQQRATTASSALNLSSSAQLHHHPYSNHPRVAGLRKKQ